MVLKAVQLKPGALDDILPIRVLDGRVALLTCKIPWASLGRSPVQVYITSSFYFFLFFLFFMLLS